MLLERVRDKQAKRKAEEEAPTHEPSKAACDREERIAEVQLQTYWACFLMDTSSADEECSGDARNLPGRTEAAAPKDQSNHGRKQLLATLRSSIIEKGQAEAKKRKVEELPKLHRNSITGKDQEDLNRGNKVEVGKDDLLETEFNGKGMQPCTNKGNIVDAKVQIALRTTSTKREAQSIVNLLQAGKAKMKRTEG